MLVMAIIFSVSAYFDSRNTEDNNNRANMGKNIFARKTKFEYLLSKASIIIFVLLSSHVYVIYPQVLYC
jgi:hypothetical protein